MHNSVKRAIARFYFDNCDYLDQVQVADVGALNIHGSSREVISHCTGFDIVDGLVGRLKGGLRAAPDLQAAEVPA